MEPLAINGLYIPQRTLINSKDKGDTREDVLRSILPLAIKWPLLIGQIPNSLHL